MASNYDEEAFEVMRRSLGIDSCCVDVGCHVGIFVDQILEISPAGTHFAFEPIPSLYESLKKKYSKKSNVQIFNCALSDSNGETTFKHVISNPGYSGIIEREFDRPNEVVEEILVPMARMDSLIPSSIRVGLIKIDVEGAELQVLQGSKEILKRDRPIVIFEHGLGAANCYGTTPADIFNILNNQLGMDIYLMSDWLDNRGGVKFSLESFENEFNSGRNYYFMAV